MTANVTNCVHSQRDGLGWHGIGVAIPAEIRKEPAKIAALCGATWTVVQHPIYIRHNGCYLKIGDYAAQVRSDNMRTLCVSSSNRYHTDNRQPVDVFEAFRDALAADQLEISHAAIHRGGDLISVCATLPETAEVAGDEIRRFVTLATGYDKANGTKALDTTIRVVCDNTYAAAMAEAGATGHYKSVRASTKIVDKSTLVHMIESARQGGLRTIEKFNQLANLKLTNEQVTRIFADVLEIDVSKLGQKDREGNKLISTRAENALKALADSYRSAPGAVQGNAWGAFNAVTHYATHVKTCRDTSGDGADVARLTSNLFGDAQAMKARAMALLMEKVAA